MNWIIIDFIYKTVIRAWELKETQSISWNWALLRMNPYTFHPNLTLVKEFCGTVLISSWQNQVPNIEFLELKFSDITST